jgi:SpoVK/Ycf46/Vps4 family AAA+-type ATPase
MSDARDLELIVRSHLPIVTIETHEEERTVRLVASVAGRVGRAIKVWSMTEGLRSHAYPSPTQRLSDELRLERDARPAEGETREPEAALRRIKQELGSGVFVLLDFHPHLSDPLIVRLMKEIAQNYAVRAHTLVLVSHELALPAELSRLSARFSLSLPDAAVIRQLVFEEAELYRATSGEKVRADKRAVELLVTNLLGLSMSDCQRLIRNAIRNDGAILAKDVQDIAKAKYALLGQDGALGFEYETANLADVGGLGKLKQWLARRRGPFLSADEKDIDRPKGALLVGVQGGGKSLAAKACAGIFGVPLLRLDFGAIYNKFHGETEKNIREGLRIAAQMAPCVLWMDEIEKGISTNDHGDGTSRRVLATLLTWMAENTARVFIVATANDIHRLPPELIRKGRLDEIFFVDLPGPEARSEIFAIHLKRRGINSTQLDLARLVAATDGYSGAEIEQVVVSARYAVRETGAPLTTDQMLAEIKQTKPLSVVMADNVAALREWARGRTVSAG